MNVNKHFLSPFFNGGGKIHNILYRKCDYLYLGKYIHIPVLRLSSFVLITGPDLSKLFEKL